MKSKVSNSKFISFAVFFAILALAAFLRLYGIADYMTFLGDEGRDVLVVYKILHGHLTLLGPNASVGNFYLGPLYYYFMTPFLYLFNYNPVGPAVMVALFGIATVALVYKIGKEFFNQKVALIAAFLYSISPLVISYSHSSWNPNLMPFFSLLTLYALYKAVVKNKIYLFLLVGFLLGITMQLHYLATFLGVIVAVYIFIIEFKKWKEIFRKYLYVLVGFLFGWSPFLAFEVRHGFNNIKSIVVFVFHPAGKDAIVESHGFFATIWDVFFRIFARLVANFPPPEQLNLYSKPLIFIWQIFILTIAVLSILVLFRKTYKKFKTQDENIKKYLLLSVWLVVGVLLFGFYRKQIYDYYFGFLFPLPFFLVANALVFMGKKSRKLLVVSVLVFIILMSLSLNGIPFRSEPNRQLNQIKVISKVVVDKSDGKPFNFAIVTAGNSDYAYRYFFKVWNVPVVEIKTIADDPKRTSVADQLLIVCEEFPCHPLGWPAWEVSGFGRAEILREWSISVVQVDKLVHYKGE